MNRLLFRRTHGWKWSSYVDAPWNGTLRTCCDPRRLSQYPTHGLCCDPRRLSQYPKRTDSRMRGG
jgi:hypothetical protein